MTTNQKFMAINQLAHASLCMSSTGMWFINWNCFISENGESRTVSSRSPDPIVTIDCAWDDIQNALVRGAHITLTPKNRYTWDGSTWIEIKEGGV